MQSLKKHINKQTVVTALVTALLLLGGPEAMKQIGVMNPEGAETFQMTEEMYRYLKVVSEEANVLASQNRFIFNQMTLDEEYPLMGDMKPFLERTQSAWEVHLEEMRAQAAKREAEKAAKIAELEKQLKELEGASNE